MTPLQAAAQLRFWTNSCQRPVRLTGDTLLPLLIHQPQWSHSKLGTCTSLKKESKISPAPSVGGGWYKSLSS